MIHFEIAGFVYGFIVGATIISVMWLLAGCAQPHRFDSIRQQQLQQQQDACLARGGTPKECRP